mmetsp:Transcript_19678/g.21893  ORF Transcript_19678/g.21893 Transcript_19678/m.21893 type:complete len:484 (+) Transcript_19678:142-1593(+)
MSIDGKTRINNQEPLPLPSTQFRMNPLQILLQPIPTNDRLFKGFSDPGSEVEKSIRRISDAIEGNKSLSERNVTTLHYSDVFQCYTSMPFYAAILRELQHVAPRIDQCKQRIALIWAQLRVVIGEEDRPLAHDFSFKRIVDAALNRDIANLGELELLFISYLLVLRLCPRFILTEEGIPTPMTPDFKKTLNRNAIHFFVNIHLCPRRDYKVERRLLKKLAGNDYRTLSNSLGTSQKIVDHLSKLKQLITLRHWSVMLEHLSQDEKNRLWSVANTVPIFSTMVTPPPIKILIQMWCQSLHLDRISVMCNIIDMLHKHGVLIDDSFGYHHGESEQRERLIMPLISQTHLRPPQPLMARRSPSPMCISPAGSPTPGRTSPLSPIPRRSLRHINPVSPSVYWPEGPSRLPHFTRLVQEKPDVHKPAASTQPVIKDWNGTRNSNNSLPAFGQNSAFTAPKAKAKRKLSLSAETAGPPKKHKKKDIEEK